MQQSTFLLEEPHANPSPSQDFAKDLLTLEGTSPSHILPLLTAIGPNGWFSRTSPVFCQQTEEKRLAPSSGRWQNSGMGSPTGCLTLNTSEHATSMELSRNDVAASSLSRILETGAVPQRYFLTPKACAGILRRLDQKGLKMPTIQKALLLGLGGMEAIQARH